MTAECIGYPTEGIQPDSWDFVLRVPQSELAKWPLGSIVNLAVRS